MNKFKAYSHKKKRVWNSKTKKYESITIGYYNLSMFNCNWNDGQLIIRKGDILLQCTGKIGGGKEIYKKIN